MNAKIHSALWSRAIFRCLLVGGFLSLSVSVTAHEGEQHGTPAPGAGAMGGPVTLSPAARANLDLKTAVVETRHMIEGPRAFGQIESLPGKSYVVSSRISGRVLRVMKVPGDAVKAGEPLIELESRVVADPPPRIMLTSALSGTVVARTVDPGQSIEPDAALLTVADLNHVYFRVDIFEVDLGQVATGQRASVWLESYPDRPFEGHIARIGQIADVTSRTIPAWIDLDNSNHNLRLNLRGRARIISKETGLVSAVPTEALLGDPANRFVYLVDGARFTPTPVQTGISDENWTEIKQGLLPGDEVVTKGNYELQYVITPATHPASSAKSDSSASSNAAPKKSKRFSC